MQKEMIVAGGCFWCIEAYLRNVPGVIKAYSGYAGNNKNIPNYNNYTELGFREAVKVIYDNKTTNYEEILKKFLESFDPTDDSGSFYDRGNGYTSAIYYDNSEEEIKAKKVLIEIEKSKIFRKPLQVKIIPKTNFYLAEEYHQNYAEKNKNHFESYEKASGREDFIKENSPKIKNLFENKK